MTTREVADSLLINKETVRLWIKKGKIKASKIDTPNGPNGFEYYISIEDFRTFLCHNKKYRLIYGGLNAEKN